MGQIYVWAGDDEVIRLFSILLNQQSHEVWGTGEPSALRSRLSISIPDLCIIDIDKLDGVIGFCDWRDEEALLAAMPCLFISGRMSRDKMVYAELLNRGCTVLEKPLQREPFLAEVEACLATTPRVSLAPEDTSQRSFSSPELEAALLDGQQLNQVEGRRVGSVVLRSELGRGGMGVVFRGRQASLGRDVAVKMILPRLLGNAEMLTRFEREALAIARLKSKHVVRVFDAGYTSERVFFIIMELLDGTDLEQVLLRDGAMPLLDALRIVRQVALGLDTAHREGLVHRDIKPSNIFVSEELHATITDFGLVRENADARLTSEGVVLGTAHYLSPEQVLNGQVDHRTDIYSLGVLFYELVVGQPPFDGARITDVMKQHVAAPVPDLRGVVPGFNDELHRILSLMMAKKSGDRFQTCVEIVQAIDAYLATQQQPLRHSRPSLYSQSRIRNGSPQTKSPSNMRSSGASQLSSLSSSQGFRSHMEHAEQLGSFRMSLSGSISGVQGVVDRMWHDSFQLLIAIIQQLEATVALGGWEETLCEVKPSSLFMGFERGTISAELFAHRDIPSILRMSNNAAPTHGPPPSTSGTSPLVALAATAGVKGLLLMSPYGEVQGYHMPEESIQQIELYCQRMAPLAQLLSTVPFKLEGMDCTFEQGRFLIWAMPQQYLFVLADHQLNKTLLSLLVWRYHNQLSQMGGGHPLYESSSGSLSSFSSVSSGSLPGVSGVYSGVRDTPVPSAPVGDLMSRKEIQSIQHEFARYIGPIARRIWKKEARKLGFGSKDVPAAKRKAIVQRLAQHLDSPKRYEFLEDIAKIS